MEFISVVHRECVGLLRLTALTLARDWSHVTWRVYVQDSSIDLAREALGEFPNIQLAECSIFNRHDGWIAQQLIKIWAVSTSEHEWVAVIGPGNLLVGEDPFFDSDGVPWIELRPDHDTKFLAWWRAAQSHRKTSAAAPSVLTPWVWRPDLVRSALAQEPPLMRWRSIPGGVEQFFYWSWAHDQTGYRPRQLTKGLTQAIDDPTAWLRWSPVDPAPWFVLHRSVWKKIDHVTTALAVARAADAIDDRAYSEFLVDYLRSRWD